MGCCGGHAGSSFIAKSGADLRRGAAAEFEYRGERSLTVFGPVTGIRYHFDAQGARLVIDPRDASVLRLAAELRQVNANLS